MPHFYRYCSLVFTMIGATLSTVQASTTPVVRVSEVQQWLQGIQKPLYCYGDVPYRQQISSHVSAELSWLVPAGSQVKKGDLLAKQNDFYLKRQLAQLDANTKAAHANYVYSFNEFDRLSRLDEGSVISSSEVQQHKRDYQTAAEQKTIYAEQYKLVEHQLSNLIHRAPADGLVLELSGEPGEWISEGESILVFLPAEKQEINCRVTLDLYQEFNQFNDVNLALADGTELLLDRHAGLVDSQDQTINLHLKFKNDHPENFFIGKRYEVNVAKDASNLTQVPYDALTINNNNYHIWRVDQGNKVKKVSAKIIDTKKNFAVIQADLQASDKVVVKGKVALKDDIEVTISNQVKL